MSFPAVSGRNIQNYPRIAIDRGSVIKPCVNHQVAAEQFIDRPTRTWRKILHDAYHDGFPYLLRQASNLTVPAGSNTYYAILIRILKFLAMFVLYVHQIYIFIYGHFYPYSLLSLDEVCDEFSRCPKWTEAVIRAFAWHPNHNRCAVAICNDYVYVYEDATRIRALRHNQQRNIVDLAWHPTNQRVLVVATQLYIIIWDITSSHDTLISTKDNSNLVNLKPGILLRHLTPAVDTSLKTPDSSVMTEGGTSALAAKNLRILENILPAPIISIRFDFDGGILYACSPNSSKIAIIDIDKVLSSDEKSPDRTSKHIQYKRKFGQGITRLAWSPDGSRLASSTTSSYIRVFERFRWSSREWASKGLIQDLAWSKPSGRMLLIAIKDEPCLYTLPFLDDAQANDVGGNKSLMKAVDLSETTSEYGTSIGGRVQAMAWDKNGKRLAVSFKDNPESVILFKTVERPTFEFHQVGVIESDNGSSALLLDFHDKYKDGSLLTICWSDGQCQHLPLMYSAMEQGRDISVRDFTMDNHADLSVNSPNGVNSPARNARSLTNFCHVSKNNSMTSYSPRLMPLSRVQHQTTLFSLSQHSILDENDSSNSATHCASSTP